MRKPLLLFLIIMFAFPCLVSAAIDTDLRIKYGTAAGIQRLELTNLIGHGSDDKGRNAQVEVVLGPHRDSPAGFIMTIGAFHRQHQSEIEDLSIPIKADYSVNGMSVAPGLRLKSNDAWTFEGKFELGAGSDGELTLNTPGVNWNTTRRGSYESVSLILGWYYLFKNSPNRVGLEVGMQKFWGDFEILTNDGDWTTGHVTGESATINIVYGFQF